jgi:hypothetical protein
MAAECWQTAEETVEKDLPYQTKALPSQKRSNFFEFFFGLIHLKNWIE